MLCVTECSSHLFRRSRCDCCHHELSVLELIPILSYLLLRGRCKHCRSTIPISLFITEILFACLFTYFSTFNTTIPLLMITFLIPLSIYDIQYFKVPDHMLFMFLMMLLWTNFPVLSNIHHILIALLIAIFLHLFYFLTRSIGYGDIKLLMILALCLPWQFFLLIFLLTYVSGGLAAIIFLFYKPDLRRLPLVPFIALSTLLVLNYFKELYLIYFGGFV